MEFDQGLDVSDPASSTCDDGRPEIPAELPGSGAQPTRAGLEPKTRHDER